jgi:UDP-N-acetylglucosamine acyltransferase
MENIHPTAIVDEQAKFGQNIKIGPYAIVEGNVIIGDNCEIMSHASVLAGARIGDNVRIHQSAVVSGLPQDLKFEGEESTCEVGNRTVIREFATINRGTVDRGTTKIGNDCLIMAYVHIAHDVFVGDKAILANSVQVAGHVTIGYHATIGGSTPIHQFVHIGDHAFIGGGLRVHKDVPPYVLAMSEPLAYAGLNRVGLERRGFSSETRDLIKKAYRILYKSTREDAIQKIEKELEMTDEIQNVLNFIKNADRGIIGSLR